MAESDKYITRRPIKSVGNGISIFGTVGFVSWISAGWLISKIFLSGDLFCQSIIFIFGFVWALLGPFSLSFFLVEAAGGALYAGNYKLASKLASAGMQVDKSVLPLVNAVGMFDTPLAVLNLLNLANAQIMLCEFEEGKDNLESALDKSQAVLGWENQLTQAVVGFLAGAYLYLCRFTEAESYLRKSIALKEKLLNELEDETEEERNSIIASLSLDKFTMALLMEHLQDFENAEEYYRQAIEVILDNTEYDTEMLANHFSRLAKLLARKNRLEEAEPLVERALEIYKKIFSDSHPIMAGVYDTLGYIAYKKGCYDEAMNWLDKAIMVRTRSDLEEHPDNAHSLAILGEIKHKQEKLEAAGDFFEKAIKIYDKRLGEKHPELLTVLLPYKKLIEEKGDQTKEKALENRIFELERMYSRNLTGNN